MAAAKKATKGKEKGPRPMAVPSSVGAAVDLLDRMRDERKAVDQRAKAMKAQEDALEEAIFGKFKKGDLEGARGKKAQCTIGRHEYPTADDWEETDRYILKNKALDLLQRRLSVEAVRERWKDGVAIPGVGKFTKVTLHLTKVKAR